MLFLFNDRIIDVDAPEMRVSRSWRALGCGDPAGLLARDALDFARRVWSDHQREGLRLDDELLGDLAALIISKTGANAALFQSHETGPCEPRLTVFPETILAALFNQRADTANIDASFVWADAA